jgi:hypothetical protein
MAGTAWDGLGRPTGEEAGTGCYPLHADNFILNKIGRERPRHGRAPCTPVPRPTPSQPVPRGSGREAVRTGRNEGPNLCPGSTSASADARVDLHVIDRSGFLVRRRLAIEAGMAGPSVASSFATPPLPHRSSPDRPECHLRVAYRPAPYVPGAPICGATGARNGAERHTERMRGQSGTATSASCGGAS